MTLMLSKINGIWTEVTKPFGGMRALHGVQADMDKKRRK